MHENENHLPDNNNMYNEQIITNKNKRKTTQINGVKAGLDGNYEKSNKCYINVSGNETS